MTLDEFVSRLSKVKRSGGRYQASCPAHDDSTASLSVGDGEKGIVVKCFAGCDTTAVVAALGLEMRDLFHDSEPAGFAGPPGALRMGAGVAAKRTALPSAPRVPLFLPTGNKANRGNEKSALPWSERVETTYDYVDENGDLLFQSVRLHSPKDFRQRQRIDGRWVWSLGNDEKGIPHARRVPYRLPALLEAAKAGRAVWVVEGEKDADALAELGFVATTNPMGAGKWTEEFVAFFEGVAGALVVPDCDAPGRKHAHEVATVLHAAGLPVKVIDLDPLRDDGFDVSDFVDVNWYESADELRSLARRAPAWTPAATDPEIVIPGVSSAEFLASVPAYDVAKDHLGPLLHGGQRVTVAGPIGHGKTSLLMEMAAASARGTEFLGWRGAGVPTYFVDLEMGGEDVAQAMSDARLPHPNFRLWEMPEGLAIDTNAQHRRTLDAIAARYRVVVIDPFHKLVGQELEPSIIRRVVDFFDGLKARHPSTCILVGFHAQQPATPRSPVLLGNISGFKAFQRNANVILTIQNVGGDTSRVRWEKTRNPRLGVKLGDVWTLEWSRGEGFRRGGGASARERLLRLLSDEWRTTSELAEEFGRSRKFTSDLLNRLAAEGRVDQRGSDAGGRGGKSWRRTTQGRIDVAA